MPCPYLTEVVMVFCRAYPAKKVPVDRLKASRCHDDGYDKCPFYQEVLAQGAGNAGCEGCGWRGAPGGGADAGLRSKGPLVADARPRRPAQPRRERKT